MTISTQAPVTAVGELEPCLLGALRVTEAALAAIFSGDLEPYIACRADRADATLLGAWGPVEKGSRALIDTFRWVGGRFAGGRSPVQATVETTVISCSGDLAYTVGFERGAVRVDAGPEQEMVIRVTHIRRLDDGWKLIHRQADFPPADQRQHSGCRGERRTRG